MSINPESSIAALVAERPSRSRIFERLGIDYCCGGAQSLGQTCAERGLDLEQIQAAIEEIDMAEDQGEPDLSRIPLSDLIGNIVATHHATLRSELPRLATLATKVREVHGEKHPELRELEKVYVTLRAELESHMLKEERILFPLIVEMESGGKLSAAHCGSVNAPIRVMVAEHEDAAGALERLRGLSGDYAAPADACNSTRALFDGLRELEEDLHRHIHKENHVLFPRASRLEAELAAKSQSAP